SKSSTHQRSLKNDFQCVRISRRTRSRHTASPGRGWSWLHLGEGGIKRRGVSLLLRGIDVECFGRMFVAVRIAEAGEAGDMHDVELSAHIDADEPGLHFEIVNGPAVPAQHPADERLRQAVDVGDVEQIAGLRRVVGATHSCQLLSMRSAISSWNSDRISVMSTSTFTHSPDCERPRASNSTDLTAAVGYSAGSSPVAGIHAPSAK